MNSLIKILIAKVHKIIESQNILYIKIRKIAQNADKKKGMGRNRPIPKPIRQIVDYFSISTSSRSKTSAEKGLILPVSRSPYASS